MTRDERQSQHALLELLVETGEAYEREIECDRELYQVIALDAKDVPHSRITAKRAACLLSEAVRGRNQMTSRTRSPRIPRDLSRCAQRSRREQKRAHGPLPLHTKRILAATTPQQ